MAGRVRGHEDPLRGPGNSGFSNDRSSYDSPPVSEGSRRRMDGRRRRSEDGTAASASPRVETIEEDEREGGASWPTKEPTVTQKRLDVVFAAQREESPRTVLGDVTNARRR